MYEFARGPLVWIAFLAFFLGSFYRIVTLVLQAKKDKVVHPYMTWKYSLRSLIHWTVPFAAHNMRRRSAFMIFSFVFHICLLVTPLFVFGHIVSWNESWGISWWSLPESLSNAMTIVVVVSIILFAMRRIADPTVRFVTSWSDWLLLIVVGGPFATGVLAYYQVFEYDTVITLHILAGAVWLTAIPFTRLIHMVFFPFTRAYMGCEFGYVRSARDW